VGVDGAILGTVALGLSFDAAGDDAGREDVSAIEMDEAFRPTLLPPSS
jgi:hypothetical protein